MNHAILLKDTYNVNSLKYIKNSKVSFYASDNYSEQPENDEEMKLNSKCPIEFKGDAVIRFYIKRKVFYYIVNGMQVLPSIAYP
jgi:hypothetical protein